MKNWPKVIVFCFSVIEFYQFCPRIVQNVYVFLPLKNRHLCRKSAFSAKCRECRIEKRDIHGKLINGHGKVMDKYFIKSVGTLK